MTTKRCALVAACLFPAVFAAAQPPPTPPLGPHYAADIERYRAWRVNDDKVNWVTLAGLFWLKPGAHSFGTSKDNDIVLPAGSTANHAGRLSFDRGEVTVVMNPGVPATIEGKPVNTAKLLSDRSGGNRHPTILQLGRLQLKVIDRGQRTGLRVKDTESPKLKAFHAPAWYPIDPAYHVTAEWEPGDGSRKIVVPNILGDANVVTIPGVAHFTLHGQRFTLTPVEGDPARSMMFVFADATTKKETYPAGRMVDAGPVKDGKLEIDFNMAYNPPCAVTTFATCPLAPRENRLSTAVHAGAKFGAKERAAHAAPRLP